MTLNVSKKNPYTLNMSEYSNFNNYSLFYYLFVINIIFFNF